MNLEDIYNSVSKTMERQKNEVVTLLEEHINLDIAIRIFAFTLRQSSTLFILYRIFI